MADQTCLRVDSCLHRSLSGARACADVKYTHKKQSGGSGQYAEVAIKFSPGEKGTGFTFKSEIKGGVVPKEYIPGVVKGLEEMMTNGALAGFPMVDLEATLYDGSYHDVDSSVLAFQIAARGAFRDAMKKGKCKLMEPVMAVDVLTPEDHMGDVIGDLNSRRGMVEGFNDRPGGMKNVTAQVSHLFCRESCQALPRGLDGRQPVGVPAGAAFGDVQLREQPKVEHQGPRLVRHEALRLQPSAAQHPGGDRGGQQGRCRMTTCRAFPLNESCVRGRWFRSRAR